MRGSTAAPRSVVGTVSLDAVADVFRALGFYPSVAELGDMRQELEARAAAAGTSAPSAIDFADMLRLFVNYRPVFGVTKDHIGEAFDVLGADGVTGQLSRVALVKALRAQGELMTASELEACLQALVGTGATDAALPSFITAAATSTSTLFVQSALGRATP